MVGIRVRRATQRQRQVPQTEPRFAQRFEQQQREKRGGQPAGTRQQSFRQALRQEKTPYGEQDRQCRQVDRTVQIAVCQGQPQAAGGCQ